MKTEHLAAEGGIVQVLRPFRSVFVEAKCRAILREFAEVDASRLSLPGQIGKGLADQGLDRGVSIGGDPAQGLMHLIWDTADGYGGHGDIF